MSARNLVFGQDVHKEFLDGILLTEKTVAGTLGPGGRTVLINSDFGGMPIVTKDGVSVAKHLVLEDANQNIATKLLIYASTQVNDSMGDGTTTTVILASRIYEQGLKLLVSGHSSNTELIQKSQETVGDIIDEIKALSKPVETKEQIYEVAYVASNSDKDVSELIVDATQKVGKDGMVLVSLGEANESKLEMREGYNYPTGPVDRAFMEGQIEVEYTNPAIAVSTDPITTNEQVVPLLQKALDSDVPLIIFAPDFSGNALTTLLANVSKGIVKILAIKLPGIQQRQDDMAEDIAVYCGTKTRSVKTGNPLDDIELEELGGCARFLVKQNDFTIIEGLYGEEDILQYCKVLKNQRDSEKSAWEAEKLQERIGRLTGGFAEIKVGGYNEAEVRERKDRFDDALNSVRTAIKAGTVTGGGLTWLKVANRLKEKYQNDIIGTIILDSLEKITWWIINNAGGNPDQFIERIRQANYGIVYNAEVGDFEDADKTSIRDSAQTLIEALKASVSTAMMLLSTECSITFVDPDAEVSEMY